MDPLHIPPDVTDVEVTEFSVKDELIGWNYQLPAKWNHTLQSDT